MLRLGFQIKRLLLIMGDFIVFLAALALTLYLRYGAISETQWKIHFLPFALLGIFWIITFYIEGLYDLSLTRDGLKLLRTFVESMVINLGLALGFFYLVPVFGIAPRTNLILDFVLILLLGYAWRLAFSRTLAVSLFRNRILFIGHGNDALNIQNLLREKGNALGFELTAMIETAPNEHGPQGPSIERVTIHDLLQTIRNRQITTIVVGHQADAIPELQNSLYQTLFLPVTLLDRAGFEELITGRVPLEYVSETWFLEHLQEGEKAWYESLKRVSDVLLSIPFGMLALILFPFVALAIRLSSPGPVLYSQIRVGKGGRTFRIWKFRTMHTDAEKTGPQFTANAKTDPRIFPIGRILRQLRIDELPQIWNVLHGDLSLVGPRPERPEFVEELTRRMPYYALRHLTRPGLTGWAQTRFLTPTATIEDNLKKLQYDLYYIKHRTPLLDIAILLKTIGIVLRRQGT